MYVHTHTDSIHTHTIANRVSVVNIYMIVQYRLSSFLSLT